MVSQIIVYIIPQSPMLIIKDSYTTWFHEEWGVLHGYNKASVGQGVSRDHLSTSYYIIVLDYVTLKYYIHIYVHTVYLCIYVYFHM